MLSQPQKIKMIKIDSILPNPYQIRRNFEQTELLELAQSIKEVGIIVPVLLRSCSYGYEIVCGQRRVRAAVLAGLAEVPAIIIRAKDCQCAEISMVENIHRKNLSYIEEGEGYYNLMSYHRIKKDKLKSRLAVGTARINEKVRLLRLSELVRYKLEEAGLDEACGASLLKLNDEEKQLEIIEKAVKEGLSGKEIDTLASKELKNMLKTERKSGKKKLSFDANIFANTIDKTIDLLKNGGASLSHSRSDGDKFIEYHIKIVKN